MDQMKLPSSVTTVTRSSLASLMNLQATRLSSQVQPTETSKSLTLLHRSTTPHEVFTTLQILQTETAERRSRVSTVPVYSKSERKKKTQIDHFNHKNITGWCIEDKCTYVVKYGYLKRITALFIHYTDTELSSVCAETAKIPRAFELKTQN